MKEMNKSYVLFNKSKQIIPGGVNSPVRAFKNVGGTPFFAKKAKGPYVWDEDDNKFIDYVGSWGPAILGHAPDVIIDVVNEVAKQGISFGIPNQYEIQLAEIICDMVPSIEKIRMVNSGTEATMSAIRLARGYTKRDKIIKFNGCYHGHVDSLLVASGSGALTLGKPDSEGVPEELAKLTIPVEFNREDIIEEIFSKEGDNIAAIIVEPYPANAGLIFPKKGYLKFLRDITKKYGSLLIFDEVMTGFRVAPGGVQEIENIVPDLTTMGKIIGGGLPVGAFGGRSDIMDLIAPEGSVYQAGTLSGNPLAMVAGITQLKELKKLDAWSKLEEKGAMLENGVRSILNELSLNLTFHRTGSMFSLFFTDNEIKSLKDVSKSNFDKFNKFFWNNMSKNVYIAPSQYETCFISMAHGSHVINDTISTFYASLKDIF